MRQIWKQLNHTLITVSCFHMRVMWVVPSVTTTSTLSPTRHMLIACKIDGLKSPSYNPGYNAVLLNVVNYAPYNSFYQAISDNLAHYFLYKFDSKRAANSKFKEKPFKNYENQHRSCDKSYLDLVLGSCLIPMLM